jgi:hypothetical protein
LLGYQSDMSGGKRRLALTLVGAAALLALMLSLVDLLAWDVFIVLLVPFLALGAARVRPMVHWTLFAVLATTTVLTIVRIEQTDSSTAGFGVIVVPLLLTVTVFVAAVVDRLLAAPLVRR